MFESLKDSNKYFMHYTVYKTTNLANGKIYIGSHVTEDVNDGYVGSGKLLLKAIEKYGLESFKKEVLHIFDNPNDMFLKEAELVSNEFIQRKDTYNIKEGGHGGWDYVNKNNLNFTQEKNARISGFKKFTKEQRIEYAKKATEEAIGIEIREVSFHAQKWITGAFASFHSDNSSNGEYNAFERSKYATFLYLNDDFIGGALNFKNYPIEIQPKTGMLAAFAGGHGNEHEVKVISSGDRYTIGSFWDDASCEYTDERREEWAAELKEVRAQQAIQQQEWADLRTRGEKLSPPQEGYGYNNV